MALAEVDPLVPVALVDDFELSDIAFFRMNFSVEVLAAPAVPEVPVAVDAARSTQPVTVTVFVELELLVCGVVVCAASPTAAAQAIAANVPVQRFLRM